MTRPTARANSRVALREIRRSSATIRSTSGNSLPPGRDKVSGRACILSPGAERCSCRSAQEYGVKREMAARIWAWRLAKCGHGAAVDDARKGSSSLRLVPAAYQENRLPLSEGRRRGASTRTNGLYERSPFPLRTRVSGRGHDAQRVALVRTLRKPQRLALAMRRVGP